ncbi:MAG: hypothetical protein KAI25_06175 [Hyphomicrobiaceae bacterium]|nr:hypothetical protein [Hyphomicrobiaceae bacterium]
MAGGFQDFFTELTREVQRRQGIGPFAPPPPGQAPAPGAAPGAATGDGPSAGPAPFGGAAGTGGSKEKRARGRATRRRSRGRGATILTDFLGRANVGRATLGGG